MMSFSKVTPETGERIADAVHNRLRSAIVRHEVSSGYHLSVPALATQFGTSRSPVHEAVKRLVAEGLATEIPRRGAFVTVYSPSFLLPLYEVRGALDGLAASQAAQRASDAEIQKMETILEDQAQAIEEDRMERHIETDIEFHMLIMSSAGNPALDEMLRQVYGRIRTAMMLRLTPSGPARALQEHQAILAAIRNRDPVAADLAARAHVQHVCGRLAMMSHRQSDPTRGLTGAGLTPGRALV